MHIIADRNKKSTVKRVVIHVGITLLYTLLYIHIAYNCI